MPKLLNHEDKENILQIFRGRGMLPTKEILKIKKETINNNNNERHCIDLEILSNKKCQKKIEKEFSGGKIITQEYYFHKSLFLCERKNNHSR